MGGRLHPQRHRHRVCLSPAGRARARRAASRGDRRLRSLVAGLLTMRIRAFALLLPLACGLAACNGNEPPKPKAVETEVPKEFTQNAGPAVEAGNAVGTPMKDRVATLGLLNKRNNISQDLVMKPGEVRRIGNVIVRLQACEKTAPWEYDPEQGAF